MKRRLITILISLFSLGFIVTISRSIYTIWQKGSAVDERIAVRDRLREENQALQEKLNEVNSDAFIESQAREKLNLQREGEVVVVLPKGAETTQDEVVTAPDKPNWQQWIQLFF